MKSEDNITTTEAILRTVAVAGLISMALLAPNTIQLLSPLLKKKRHQGYYINQRVKQMQRQGLVEIKKDGQEFLISLTKKGERELLRSQIKSEIKSRDQKWDQKWRVIVFDIKEFKRRERDMLRAELLEFGFIRLQNSVWVTPYDCEQFVELLKIDIGLGREVVYMVVDKIENDGWLKKEFGL